jgi:excinuclease ABC subunit C
VGPGKIEFAPERDHEIFEQVPASAAVFAVSGPAGDPYVSKTSNLRRRLLRLLGEPAEHSRKLSLRDRVTQIEYWPTASDFESWLVLYRVLRERFPDKYRERLRLRFAPLIKLNLDNPYPRAYVTTRVGRLNSKSFYYGPFRSRDAAERFLNDSLDFFKMRRCVDDLAPDPSFPGCIYSEMKMCLAPCFRGCTDEQYAAEAARVARYFDSEGASLERELVAERDEASERLEFEAASALHARIEKAGAATAQRPEIARRVDLLSALIVQRSSEPGSVNLFVVEAGRISPAIAFRVSAQPVLAAENHGRKAHSHAHSPVHSMEARIEEALAMRPAMPTSTAGEVMEHLALLKRWYFRGSRTGEIFLADERGELPMRRIVRGISRVYRGEAAEAQAPPAVVQISGAQ